MSKSAFELAEELALKRMADEDVKKAKAVAEMDSWKAYVGELLRPISDAVSAANSKYPRAIREWSAFRNYGVGFDVAPADHLTYSARFEIRDRSGKACLLFRDKPLKEGEIADLLPAVIDIIADALAARRAVR